MPELPEVEIIVRHLRQVLTGRRILQAKLIRGKLAPSVSPHAFATRLRGSEIVEISRRGKNILIRLDNHRTLVTHLRMSGQFLLVDSKARPAPHTHAIFTLDRDEKLFFTDQRHFGWMTIVDTTRESNEGSLASLGYEPLDAGFTPDLLYQALRRSRRAIKLFLLDQHRIAGLGNIYVAEALFIAGIAPQSRAHRISRARSERLHQAIVEVLRKAIQKGSTEKLDPPSGNSVYIGGEFDSTWFVYDREGEPCHTCGTPIRRTIQGQRSSYYCPGCQKR